MTSLSAGYIIQTPTQPVDGGRGDRTPRSPDQVSRALPTELPLPRAPKQIGGKSKKREEG